MALRGARIALALAVSATAHVAWADTPEPVTSEYVPAGWQDSNPSVESRGVPKNRRPNPQPDADRHPDDHPHAMPGDQALSPAQRARVQNLRRDAATADSLDQDGNLGAVLRIEQTRARVLAARKQAGQDTSDEVVEQEVKVRETIRKKVKAGLDGSGLTGEERERELDARVESELAFRRKEARKVFDVSKNTNPSDLEILKNVDTSLQNWMGGPPPSYARLRRMAADRKDQAELGDLRTDKTPQLKIKRKPMDPAQADAAEPQAQPAAPDAAAAELAARKRQAEKLKKSRDKHERLLKLNEQERLPTGEGYDAQMARLERQALAKRLKLKAAKATLSTAGAAPAAEATSAESTDKLE